MSQTSTTQKAPVVPISPVKEKRESEKKWGKPVIDIGFCIIPSLIFRAQQRLGLNPTQLAVLLQLADFWWDNERKPYPSKKSLSERLGLSPRHIQRCIAELEKAGFVERIERRAPHKGKLTNEYDLSGLVAKLKKLEPEFKEASEKSKNIQRQVKRKGGLKNMFHTNSKLG